MENNGHDDAITISDQVEPSVNINNVNLSSSDINDNDKNVLTSISTPTSSSSTSSAASTSSITSTPPPPASTSTSTSTTSTTLTAISNDASEFTQNNHCPLDDQQGTIKMASNMNDKQPEMDCLLEKLRKGMTELSHQGDDFTKQMWNMYATFEDMISGSGQRDERSRSTLLELSNNTTSLKVNHINNTNTINNDCTVDNNTTINNNPNCTSTSISNPEGSDSISSSSSPESELTDEKTCNSTNLLTEMANVQYSNQLTSKESTVDREKLPQSTVTSLSLEDRLCRENSVSNVINNYDNNHKETNRRFRPIPHSKGKLLAARQQSNMGDKPVTNLGGYQSDSGSNSSLANPLLDTISCLTSSDPYSDSDDYDVTRNKVIHQRARRRCRRMLSDRSLRCSPNHLHSCCSSDADSIGYAGSNSIDSGYKSLCPTPEVTESVSNLLPYKTTDIPSVGVGGSKVQIAAQTDDSCLIMASSNSTSSMSAFQRINCLATVSSTINKQPYSDHVLEQPRTHSPTSSISSIKSRTVKSNCCEPTTIKNSSSSTSIFGLHNGNKTVSRLKNQSTEAHLEHLLTLRQSLISAIQKCESSTSTPTDSRVASPVISSRSTSPASTVIPRTVSNLKITSSSGLASLTSSSSPSIGPAQGSNGADNHMYQHQSSNLTSSLSSYSSNNSGPIMAKCKRLSSSSSPEPWYSQHSQYSPLATYHPNCHAQSQYTASRCSNRITNPPPQMTLHDHHQSNESVTSSLIPSASIDAGRITPTQRPPATFLDVIGQQKQHSSSLNSLNCNNKSVRFEEVMITPFTNYHPVTSNNNMSNNTLLEIADYQMQSTERPIPLVSINTFSMAPIMVTSGHLSTDNSGSSNSLSSNINGNFNTDNSNHSNDTNCNINNNNVGDNGDIYNGISRVGSSSSVKSSTGTFSTKSILKDPICANLRSSIESGKFNAAQSLENEIDSLLYGKRFNDPVAPTGQITSIESDYSTSPASHQVESTDLCYNTQLNDPLDIPYVKMIEEKYRTGNKVNKTSSQDHIETFTSQPDITNNPHHSTDPVMLPEGVNETNGPNNYQSKPSNNHYHQSLNHSSGSHLSLNNHYYKHQKPRSVRNGSALDNPDNARIDPMSKSKISEMAKCMLGILDEIEMKNSIENRLPSLETVKLREEYASTRPKERSRPSSAEFRGSIEMIPSLLNNGETASESSYHSLPEYHIYEEVAYDSMIENQPINRLPATGVPPLPSSSQPTNRNQRSSSVRRMLPPNPTGSSSLTMLNNLRFTGKSSGSSVYRSSLKDFFKSCDGNKNPRMFDNSKNSHRETELKCFRSSSASPLASSTSLINSSTVNESTWQRWGRATEQPKQRGNLYSLFTDPNQRINIGRSLRKEFNHSQQPQSNIHLELCNGFNGSSSSSEYGFKNS